MAGASVSRVLPVVTPIEEARRPVAWAGWACPVAHRRPRMSSMSGVRFDEKEHSKEDHQGDQQT